jgi:predicted AlkP superfamily phosphohydrolase/phosphomutase/tetratricopeptide (TPR) repeat protein
MVKAKGNSKKVLLVGWDAADWRVITPLIQEGKMPTLAWMLNHGVSGNLATLFPSLSPTLWTSISTGFRPFKHGILDFTEPDPLGKGIRPVTTLSRKVKAFWNILTQEGYRTNVVGWWPSNPAEPINGVMVSNLYQQSKGNIDQPWPMAPGTVHPPELAETLAEFRMHPQEMHGDEMLPFIPNADKIDQEKDRRLFSCAKIVAEATGIHAAATYLMDETEWDMMAVYYDAIDHFCHGFMKYHPPKLEGVNEDDFEMFKHVVNAGYQYHDLMLRVLLSKVDPDTTVILISDHGFHPDHRRPRRIPREPAGPAHEHRNYGIFVAVGPNIKKGAEAHGASIIDVTPTVLTLFGLPVGADMDGRPLIDIFAKPPLVESIPSWENVPGAAGQHPPNAKLDPADAREALRQLEELGYIDPQEEDPMVGIEKTRRESRYNEARSLIDAMRHEEAIPILEELYREHPKEHRFGIRLAFCYMALGRTRDLRRVVDAVVDNRKRQMRAARKALKALREKMEASGKQGKEAFDTLEDMEQREVLFFRREIRDRPFGLYYLQGAALFSEGALDDALEHLNKAVREEEVQPDLHTLIGMVQLAREDWAKAEDHFRSALSQEPLSPNASTGLCRALLKQRRNFEAAAEALSAVQLRHVFPEAHFYYAVALHRLGRVGHAVEELKTAIEQQPDFPEAHQRLAYIYKNRLKRPRLAQRHQRLAKASRSQRRFRKEARQAEIEDWHRLTEEEARPELPPQMRPPPKPSGVHGKPGEHPPMDSREWITIVSGLPRSGTSLMMQMLQAGGLELMTDGEREGDEDNPRGYFELEKVKQLGKDNAWLDEAKGKGLKIVAPLLPFLKPGLPYRVIFMQRDPEELLASQRKMLDRAGKEGANLDPEKLKLVYQRHAQDALRVLQMRQVPTLLIPYRGCIENPEEAAKRINALFGYTLDADAMMNVIDPTLYRNRT